MPWSPDLQHYRDLLADELIKACRMEVGDSRPVTIDTDPCPHLGICDEDLDDIQIAAAASVGLRPPSPGEPLIMPWYGPDRQTSIGDLAAWLAVNGRPL
jgi:hypothetical protein